MFSATFNILPGSKIHPSIATVITDQNYDTQVSRLNTLGYIPLVSTITGCCRALLGIIHAIVHLVVAIFSKDTAYHLGQAALGGRNIARGLIEMVPIIGNVALLGRDLVVAWKSTCEARKYAESHRDEVTGRSVLFVDNENVASKSFVDMIQLLTKEGYTPNSNPPQFWDIVRCIQA